MIDSVFLNPEPEPTFPTTTPEVRMAMMALRVDDRFTEYMNKLEAVAVAAQSLLNTYGSAHHTYTNEEHRRYHRLRDALGAMQK